MNICEVEKILSSLPREVLCRYETAVQRLLHFERLSGLKNLYVKREDLNGIGPGGSKVRALEYLLGEAVKQKSDVVIASGQDNSNLCTIAAAACCKLGLGCTLVHNNVQPEKPVGNSILNNLLGVERIYIGAVKESERNEFVDSLSRKYLAEGKKPFVIENGATTPLGAVGYAHVILELLRHKNEYQLTDIFVPGGNGGLAAGIIMGNFLAGTPYRIRVITVENTVEDLSKIIETLVLEMKFLLGIEESFSLDRAMTIYGEYRGDGWGISTPESDEMICNLASVEGIFLEKTYTSKTFLGMIDLLDRGVLDVKGACFIHSGGFSALFGQFA